MRNIYTRRDFLKLSALGLGGLAFSPFSGPGSMFESGQVVRVANHQVSVYSRPSDKSTILYQRRRDDLINVYEEVTSPDGPGFNPKWYRVWRGYVHSGRLQEVEARYNPVASGIPKGGQLATVTVPYTQTMRYATYQKAWEPLYRLYYQSNHWVTGIEEGPDGSPWYQLHDELLEIKYLVPAAHLRLIKPEEFAPISPEMDPWDKRIEISLGRQTLRAFEKDKVVLECKVSTGVPDSHLHTSPIQTDTPSGEYHVFSKMPSKHMGDGRVTSDLEAYELPGVPWTTFFVDTGVAIHGTYWHQNYGAQMSRGCVNVTPEVAQWVFRWTTPVSAPETWEQRGYGTVVQVIG
jgi:hypothetical protein